MTIERSEDLARPSTASLVGRVVRHYLGGRRGLIILGAGALVLGVAFNWGWLVAAGIAPLLLTALPCVAMCALGLCANKMMSRSGVEQPSSKDATSEAAPPAAVPLQLAASPEERANRSADADKSPGATSDKNSCCHNP